MYANGKQVRLLIYWCSIAETDMATWFQQVDGHETLTGCLVQRLHAHHVVKYRGADKSLARPD